MPPWVLLDAALTSGRFRYALRIARTMSPLPLKESARLLHLAATAEDGADPDWYEKAAVHWLARYCTEARGVTLAEARRAVEALDGLDQSPAQLDALITLTERPR